MAINDPYEREYEPAIRFFRECTRVPVRAHAKVAKWALALGLVAAVVIAPALYLVRP